MQQIPKVDLNDFLSANPNDKKQFIAQLGSAFEEIGFVALRGHFLSSKLMEDLYTEIKAFFDLSLEEKKQYEVELFKAKSKKNNEVSSHCYRPSFFSWWNDKFLLVCT